MKYWNSMILLHRVSFCFLSFNPDLLGYAEQNSFLRAFTIWTGKKCNRVCNGNNLSPPVFAEAQRSEGLQMSKRWSEWCSRRLQWGQSEPVSTYWKRALRSL